MKRDSGAKVAEATAALFLMASRLSHTSLINLYFEIESEGEMSALLRARRLAGGTPARKGVSRTTDSESWAGNGNGVS